MNGNEKFLPDIAIPVATSVSFICLANEVKKENFIWKKASFSSQDFREIEQSNAVVIDSRDGESKITLTEASFDKSGVYQCETKIHSARVNLHVYGCNLCFDITTFYLVADSGGTDIKSSPLSKDLQNIPIKHNVPDIHAFPTAFCKFQVGQHGINYATVRWFGEGLSLYPEMFEITESKNSETGIIYSNLTIHVTCRFFIQSFKKFSL